jgi:hypothetical protein
MEWNRQWPQVNVSLHYLIDSRQNKIHFDSIGQQKKRTRVRMTWLLIFTIISKPTNIIAGIWAVP